MKTTPALQTTYATYTSPKLPLPSAIPGGGIKTLLPVVKSVPPPTNKTATVIKIDAATGQHIKSPSATPSLQSHVKPTTLNTVKTPLNIETNFDTNLTPAVTKVSQKVSEIVTSKVHVNMNSPKLDAEQQKIVSMLVRPPGNDTSMAVKPQLFTQKSSDSVTSSSVSTLSTITNTTYINEFLKYVKKKETVLQPHMLQPTAGQPVARSVLLVNQPVTPTNQATSLAGTSTVTSTVPAASLLVKTSDVVLKTEPDLGDTTSLQNSQYSSLSPQKKSRKSTPRNIKDLKNKNAGDGRYNNIIDTSTLQTINSPSLTVMPCASATQVSPKYYPVLQVNTPPAAPVKQLPAATNAPSVSGNHSVQNSCVSQSNIPAAAKPSVVATAQNLIQLNTVPLFHQFTANQQACQNPNNNPFWTNVKYYTINQMQYMPLNKERFYPMTQQPINLNTVDETKRKTQIRVEESAKKQQTEVKSKSHETNYKSPVTQAYKKLTRALEDDLKEFEKSLGEKSMLLVEQTSLEKKKRFLVSLLEDVISKRRDGKTTCENIANGAVTSDTVRDERVCSESLSCTDTSNDSINIAISDRQSLLNTSTLLSRTKRARIKLIDCIKYKTMFRKKYPNIKFITTAMRKRTAIKSKLNRVQKTLVNKLINGSRSNQSTAAVPLISGTQLPASKSTPPIDTGVSRMQASQYQANADENVSIVLWYLCELCN